MKQLAAKADERWNSVPSFLDAPKHQQPAAATNITDSKPANPKETLESSGVQSAVAGVGEGQQADEIPKQDVGREAKRKREKKENPWERPDQGGPSENWQPASWSPGVAQRR